MRKIYRIKADVMDIDLFHDLFNFFNYGGGVDADDNADADAKACFSEYGKVTFLDQWGFDQLSKLPGVTLTFEETTGVCG